MKPSYVEDFHRNIKLRDFDGIPIRFLMINLWKFQVKGLLKDKKLETLVDSDLQGNYVDEQVEELIQVALLCTQYSPSERPKMSEVVRMLEGDGLAERWEEWQKEEMFRQEFTTAHNPNTDWIIADSTYNLRPDELSGPRWSFKRQHIHRFLVVAALGTDIYIYHLCAYYIFPFS